MDSAASAFRSVGSSGTPEIAILSGTYLSRKAIARRIAISRPKDITALYWGERLSNRSMLFPIRKLYFGGLDAVLAIGTWAVPTYRAVYSGPIHVFPYVTRGVGPVVEPASRPVIGFVGSLIERKALGFALSALAAIPAPDRPRIEVAGSGPQRPLLEAYAREAAIEIEWLGEVDASDLPPIQGRWWAQLVPSRYDGWGVVVPEALSMGVPVLATPHVGAARDLVRDGYNGLVRPAVVEQWAEGIRALCEQELATRDACRRTSYAFGAERAATFLQQVLTHVSQERSFIDEGWRDLENADKL